MSAFGYFGSKLRIARKLCGQLPPHHAWVELFCGSAAMTLAKKPVEIEVINDLNGNIINFFKELRDHGTELRKLIRLTPYSREEFDLARLEVPKLSDLERARRFFVTAMMAINGSFGADAGGFSFSNSYSRNGMEARVNRWHKMTEYLESVVDRLRKVRVENRDAMVLFNSFKNRPGTLVYLDPPYLGPRIRGYDHDQNTVEFHEQLLRQIIKAKCMVFISGYPSDLYERYLTPQSGWVKETMLATTKGHNGKTFERQEVIWFNKPYVKAKQSCRVPLRLTKAEKPNRQINPERLG